MIVFMTIVVLVVSACGSASTPTQPPATQVPATEPPTEEIQPTETVEPDETSAPVTDTPLPAAQADEPQFPNFDLANFENSAIIDNEWLPMKPGTKWAYEGTALDDQGNNVDRRIEFTVTDLTKEIEGVRTLVLWIEDFNNGEGTEKELSFYAQDKQGNIWYFGEHPEDFEDGAFVEAKTWIAGLADAKPGIVLSGEPKLGMPNLYQGWGPEVGWSDFGRVEKMGLDICVPVSCYKDVLENAETSLSEVGAFQLKYYVRGVGEIKVGWSGNDETHEELQLVEFKQLSPEEMDALRTQAVDLEKHAYEVSDVYKQTTPAEYADGTPVTTKP